MPASLRPAARLGRWRSGAVGGWDVSTWAWPNSSGRLVGGQRVLDAELLGVGNGAARGFGVWVERERHHRVVRHIEPRSDFKGLVARGPDGGHGGMLSTATGRVHRCRARRALASVTSRPFVCCASNSFGFWVRLSRVLAPGRPPAYPANFTQVPKPFPKMTTPGASAVPSLHAVTFTAARHCRWRSDAVKRRRLSLRASCSSAPSREARPYDARSAARRFPRACASRRIFVRSGRVQWHGTCSRNHARAAQAGISR
jgi:hypothetical protein